MPAIFFESALERKTGSNPLGLKGIDHIEFIVDDADQWADFFVNKYGMARRFYADAASGVAGRRAHVVGQGRINFLLAEPQGTGPEADFMRWHLAEHGNGVRDVAFRVKDARAALAEAARRGAKVVRPLDEHDSFNGGSIAAYGDTLHTFIERKPHTDFAPGYRPVPGGFEDGDIHFAMIDHVVANVEHMEEWVEFYEKIFGFDLFMHFDINTGRSALMSKVVSSTDGWVKLPINEPSSQNSQIQEFLDKYNGPGVQHIALLTPNIVATVAEMRRMGQDFLDVPESYYDAAFDERIGTIEEDKEELKRLKILVDRDHEGYLLQLFTKCVFARPTLFFEVIQRRGRALGFGEGNFRALFEAIEREQAKRGAL
ncbi:4-hydroxyphenylpyruvate dioxygenase [Horticoccus luteus]|uniref:4-hydroxyphenylpyruvate dioxygenase n=1 Tax=Horticoccus luteus TaxID=2862869 RepID=A0A8F9XJK9_9BACT|nr:4-hydroxyphenylpyruvate dioxygenase [Horticoccus luteus]QYM78773.1 4-hydroxyphenylpyruvate dioxygenase [Horticoccus luteus]